MIDCGSTLRCRPYRAVDHTIGFDESPVFSVRHQVPLQPRDRVAVNRGGVRILRFGVDPGFGSEGVGHAGDRDECGTRGVVLAVNELFEQACSGLEETGIVVVRSHHDEYSGLSMRSKLSGARDEIEATGNGERFR